MSFRDQITPGRTYRCLTILLSGPNKDHPCGFVKTPDALNVTCGHTMWTNRRPVIWEDTQSGEKITITAPDWRKT